MTIYEEDKVWKLYSANYQEAIRNLKTIQVFCGNEPRSSGLGGWVFEQTIQYCIKRELQAKRVKADILEQVKLGPRGKADLQIGDRVALEIKLSGLFSKEGIAKFRKYKKTASSVGWEYLYLTGEEGHKPYRDGVTDALGAENTFFLDTRGEWHRFIKRLLQLLKEKDKRSIRHRAVA